MSRRLLWLAADLLLAGILLAAVWFWNYQLPQKGVKVQSMQNTAAAGRAETPGAEAAEGTAGDGTAGDGTGGNSAAG